jgi:hypothetical protein
MCCDHFGVRVMERRQQVRRSLPTKGCLFNSDFRK